MSEHVKKQIFKFLSFSVVIFLIIILLKRLYRFFYVIPNKISNLYNKKLIESLDNMTDSDFTFMLNPVLSFCKSNIESDNMQTECGNLTNKNCNKTNCCIWLNNKKCVPGDEKGPTYTTDNEGKNIYVNNYFFNNKCYGKCS